MYGLAVNLIMSVSGHPSIINEMYIVMLHLHWKVAIYPAAKHSILLRSLLPTCRKQ